MKTDPTREQKWVSVSLDGVDWIRQEEARVGTFYPFVRTTVRQFPVVGRCGCDEASHLRAAVLRLQMFVGEICGNETQEAFVAIAEAGVDLEPLP
jgi:hypothetical protein